MPMHQEGWAPLAEAHRSDPAAPAAASGGDAEALWRGSGTVLVVDEDATARSVAAAMLEERGFSVLTAADGQEGVARCFEPTAARSKPWCST